MTLKKRYKKLKLQKFGSINNKLHSIQEEQKMKKVNVYVTLRESVVDPQGTAAKKALQNMGYEEVQNVRVGKLIELELDGETADLEARVDAMCKELLVNRVIEDYRFEIEEA